MHYNLALEDNFSLRGLALEAGILSNMVDSIKKFFPDLLQGVDGVFSQFTNLDKPAPYSPVLRGLETKIVEKLKAVPYEELTRLTVQVPEGFKGPYLDYYDALADGYFYRTLTTMDALDEYYILVSSVLTNRNAKISLRDETRRYRELAKSREALNKVITGFFKAGSSQAQLQYTDLVAQNPDVEHVFKEAKIMDKMLQDADLDEMKNHVKRITSALQLLIDQAQNGDAQHISPEVAKNLAQGAYEMAAQVEFFSMNYFRMLTLQTSVQNFTDKLEKRLF